MSLNDWLSVAVIVVAAVVLAVAMLLLYIPIYWKLIVLVLKSNTPPRLATLHAGVVRTSLPFSAGRARSPALLLPPSSLFLPSPLSKVASASVSGTGARVQKKKRSFSEARRSRRIATSIVQQLTAFPSSLRFTISSDHAWLLAALAHRSLLQTLRQSIAALEAERDALEAKANAKLAERSKELEEFRARAGDLSAKLEVCKNYILLPCCYEACSEPSVGVCPSGCI